MRPGRAPEASASTRPNSNPIHLKQRAACGGRTCRRVRRHGQLHWFHPVGSRRHLIGYSRSARDRLLRGEHRNRRTTAVRMHWRNCATARWCKSGGNPAMVLVRACRCFRVHSGRHEQVMRQQREHERKRCASRRADTWARHAAFTNRSIASESSSSSSCWS
jgi:hypothetical protein